MPEGDPADPASLSTRALAALPGLRACVVGDCVIDRHTRIAHDPAFDDAVTTDPGGAAVIALHLRRLGTHVTLVTRLCPGHDGSQAVRSALDTAGVRLINLGRATPLPTKRRVLRDGRVIARKPQGGAEACDNPVGFARALDDALARDPRLVIACDFGLGLFDAESLTDLERRAAARGAYVAGDVSGRQPTLAVMRGFDLVTPTAAELYAVPGLPDDPWRAARAWVQQSRDARRPRTAIVTMGARGLVAAQSGGAAASLPTMAREAVDPIGAGDALLAAASAAGALGLRMEDQARWAAAAAAVHVEDPGNRPLNRDAWLDRLARDGRRPLFQARADASPAAA
ncbi:MAG: carbohydrate kinase family protein [Planctomycetota bacterium]